MVLGLLGRVELEASNPRPEGIYGAQVGGCWDVTRDVYWEEDLGGWARLEKDLFGPLMTSVSYQVNRT